MPNDRTIPSERPKTVVSFTITSNGTEIPATYNLLSIVVHHEVNRIPAATLIFADGDPASQSFDVSNAPEFEPGREIQIQLGYQGTNETAFKGIVVRHGIKTRKKNSILQIECKDKAAKMTAACHSQYFKEVSDSDVIEQLIDKYSLEKEVEATTVQHLQMVQYNATDWDFMLCRAEVNSMLCLVKEGKVNVKKPALTAEPVLTIQYGATVHELDAEIDARLQYKAVIGSSWNYTNQELLDDVEAAEPALPEAGNIDSADLAGVLDAENYTLYHSGKIDEPELQQWVDAKMMKQRLAQIRGQVKTDGTVAVSPGDLITLEGAGERFEGKLFVSGVRQQVENGNWQTNIQFGLNPEWFTQSFNVQQPMAGALLPAIQGLQNGVVTGLEGDPDGEDRIMVRIPVIHKEDEGAWCRISALDAGDARGMIFRPEIGDEVLIGFINNDPRHGVVLGMLNSSSLPAHLPPSDDNHEKGYQSRSGMKIIFNDEKKSISIETPGGHKVIIDEDASEMLLEDLNGNKIVMNQDGITIESIKDIVMKASADVNVEGGSNVNVKGGAQLKAEGGAGAEISSGGSTNVKGSIVNIN